MLVAFMGRPRTAMLDTGLQCLAGCGPCAPRPRVQMHHGDVMTPMTAVCLGMGLRWRLQRWV